MSVVERVEVLFDVIEVIKVSDVFRRGPRGLDRFYRGINNKRHVGEKCDEAYEVRRSKG